MSGAKIRVELDDGKTQAFFSRVVQGSQNALGLFTEIGSALEASTRERIETTKQAPDGTPWLPISESWRLTKKERGQAEGILTMRGDLLNSVTFEAGAAFVDIIAGPTEYAAIHQFGGQAGRGKKTTIPARPYMGLSEEDQTEIREAVDGWLQGLGQR